MIHDVPDNSDDIGDIDLGFFVCGNGQTAEHGGCALQIAPSGIDFGPDRFGQGSDRAGFRSR